MPNTKKQTREERLLKKRIAERKRKERIKNDPVLLEELRKKERERYHSKKAEGKILPLYEMPIRERRLVQRNKKMYNKAYYTRKKAARMEATAANLRGSESITESPQNDRGNTYSTAQHSNSTRMSRSSSRYPLLSNSDAIALRPRNCRDCSTDSHTRRSHRVFLRSQRDSIESNGDLANNLIPISSNNLHTSSPLQRPPPSPLPSPCVSSIHSNYSTVAPSSPTSDLSVSSCKCRNIQNKYRRCQQNKSRQIIMLQKRVLELRNEKNNYRKRIERLERLVKLIKAKAPIPITKKVQQKIRGKIGGNSPITKQVRRIVIDFYENDENSQVCPGKNDFITKNQLKKQKRYQTDTLRNLHHRYLNSGNPPISYTTFCRLRPFWIRKPDLNTRNTCLCKMHDNMELLIRSLKKYKIIRENTSTAILKTLCCDKNNVDCLQRNCSFCKSKNVLYQEFDNSNSMIFWQWEKTVKVYVKNNIEKSTNAIEKVKHVKKPLQVIKIFENSLDSFLKHCGNIKNQYNTTTAIKKNLTETECLVHIDFSENYAAKYASEIQSVHFGASRPQFTLHTAVIYHRSNQNQSIVAQPFCTVSTSLRHDASAVWAHMVPILTEIESINPNTNTLHIVSDSPSAQYRNKKIFYTMSQLSSYCPSLTCVVWHYCECGHGKGAPDGVGGFLKRTADQLVSFGNDITDIDSFICALKAASNNIQIKRVEDYEIVEKDWLIPQDLKPFPGNMKVHQVIWRKSNYSKLALRALSCTKPHCLNKPIACPHGKHLGFYNLPLQNIRRDSVVYRSSSSTANKNYNEMIRPLQQKRVSTVANKFILSPKTTTISQNKTSSIGVSNIDSVIRECGTNTDFENVVPTSSFFENINTDTFSKFENSRDASLRHEDEDQNDVTYLDTNFNAGIIALSDDDDDNYNIF